MLNLIRLYKWVIIDENNEVASVHPNLNKVVGFHLKGKVFGHPKAKDGSLIKTSEVIDVVRKEQGVEIYTSSGTLYTLGGADPNTTVRLY